MAEPAFASSTSTTPAASTGGAASSSYPSTSHTSHPPSYLPPLLSRLSSPRAAPASVSAVNAVGVSGIGSGSGGSGAPTTSAAASLATRDESMLRVVRRADSVSTTTATATSTSTTTTAAPSSSTATASTRSTAVASAASPSAAPTSSVSSVSIPVIGGGPLIPAPAAPLLPPATGAALAEPLGGGAFPPGHAGPASVATAPAALASASNYRRPQPPASLPHPPLQPSLPSASAQRHIAEARQALDASIANLLDTQLQSRAVLMHNNMRSIENQQRDLGKAVLGLRKANDGLAHLVHEMTGPLKEMGNMQNWTEVQFQGLSAIDETLRLVREKRERRERREKAAVEREARREARKAARLEAGLPEEAEDGHESDGSSDSGTYWSSSYYSCSSRSRSRSRSASRSHSRSRQGSPSRDKATTDAPIDRKGKGKAKMEDIVENVRAMPSSSQRKENIIKDKDKKNDASPKEAEKSKTAYRSTEAADNGKGKETEKGEVAEAAVITPSVTNDDKLPAPGESPPTEAQTEPQDTLATPHADTTGPGVLPAVEGEVEQPQNVPKEEFGTAQTAPRDEAPEAEEVIEPTKGDQTELAPTENAPKERDASAEEKVAEDLVDKDEDGPEQVIKTPTLQDGPSALDSGPDIKEDVTQAGEASPAELELQPAPTVEPTIEDVVVTDKPATFEETSVTSETHQDDKPDESAEPKDVVDVPSAPAEASGGIETVPEESVIADTEVSLKEVGKEAHSMIPIATLDAAEDTHEEHPEQDDTVPVNEADETSSPAVEDTYTAKDAIHPVDITHEEDQATEQAEQLAAGSVTEQSHALVS